MDEGGAQQKGKSRGIISGSYDFRETTFGKVNVCSRCSLRDPWLSA